MSESTISLGSASKTPTMSAAWLGGLVLSGIGAGLATTALTMPWISLRTAPSGPRYELLVTSLPGQGPVFALLLVLTAVLAALGFTAARRVTAPIRAGAVVLGPMPAAVALFAGLRPNTAKLRGAVPTYVTQTWDLQNPSGAKDLPVSAMNGLTLYTAGLLLIGLGLVIATLNSSGQVVMTPTSVSARSQRRAPIKRWAALSIAVPLILLSLSLAWFEVDTPDGGMPAVAAGWVLIYRIGLVATLAILVATTITIGVAQRVLRSAGLYVCSGLASVLALNVLLLWDPSGLTAQISVELTYVKVGPAYFAAVGAVLLLLVLLATSAPIEPPPGCTSATPDQNGSDSEPSDERTVPQL